MSGFGKIGPKTRWQFISLVEDRLWIQKCSAVWSANVMRMLFLRDEKTFTGLLQRRLWQLGTHSFSQLVVTNSLKSISESTWALNRWLTCSLSGKYSRGSPPTSSAVDWPLNSSDKFLCLCAKLLIAISRSRVHSWDWKLKALLTCYRLINQA